MIENNRQNAHQEIDHIFKKLLPAHGMAERPVQVALSHRMLDAMLDDSIALCDAGTGIGKTYAYLVAGIVFSRSRAARGLANQPVLISTSSIALQNAVLEEYLPFLSSVLIEDRMTKTPIRAVLRKGKSHYVCDERLKRRLQAVDLTRKSPRARDALLSLRDHLDLDMAEHLSGYDRMRVCVPMVCDCGRESCRYQCFMEMCASDWYQVQICNHNLLLADAIHRNLGRRPLLPEWSTLILDEAHKLPETARQMFGITLTAAEIHELIRALRGERYLLASETLEEAAGPALRELARPWDEDKTFSHFAPFLNRPHHTLELIQKQIGTVLTHGTQRKLDQLRDKTALFLQEQRDMIFYTAEDSHGGTMLCATTPNLTNQLRQTLWRQQKPMILTSGTLAVGEDFRRFKEATGLLTDSRVRESVSPSPFTYSRNCLMYVSRLPAHQGAGQYYDSLTAEIAALLDAAHGHALLLFTSYAAMSAVKERLREQDLAYPLFTLGRNAVHTTKQFKSTPGGVLLATGAAWEGFDFPGDCVSLLVIPRLPFPIPDALKEKEREQYPTLHSFLRGIVVPEMQIKLKQGFGRAIRLETDTCVVAILDERAARNQRYWKDVLAALPEMPVTQDIHRVEAFIRGVKPDSYFQEGAA